ncbi:MAG TPA: hypothetical protein VHR47_07025 [Bacillota bacterium]|nr:hypothetical protein [Bacillota bacterium]
MSISRTILNRAVFICRSEIPRIIARLTERTLLAFSVVTKPRGCSGRSRVIRVSTSMKLEYRAGALRV